MATQNNILISGHPKYEILNMEKCDKRITVDFNHKNI